MNLLTVKEVIEIGWDKLARERGLGPGTINEIRELMDKVERLKDRIKGLAGSELLYLLARRDDLETE